MLEIKSKYENKFNSLLKEVVILKIVFFSYNVWYILLIFVLIFDNFFK